MADYEERPKVRVKQAKDGSGGSFALNITALVLVVIAFLLHNWPARAEAPRVAQNNTAPVASGE